MFLTEKDARQLLVACIHLQGENDGAFLIIRHCLQIDDLVREVFFLQELDYLFSVQIITQETRVNEDSDLLGLELRVDIALHLGKNGVRLLGLDL